MWILPLPSFWSFRSHYLHRWGFVLTRFFIQSWRSLVCFPVHFCDNGVPAWKANESLPCECPSSVDWTGILLLFLWWYTKSCIVHTETIVLINIHQMSFAPIWNLPVILNMPWADLLTSLLLKTNLWIHATPKQWHVCDALHVSITLQYHAWSNNNRSQAPRPSIGRSVTIFHANSELKPSAYPHYDAILTQVEAMSCK